MAKTPKKSCLTLAIIPVFLTQIAEAHVIWFDYDDGNYELLFGHPEEGPEALTPNKFREATAFSSTKNIVPSDVSFEGNRLFVEPQGEVAALTAFYDNGFWLENPDGTFENLTSSQAQAINYENFTSNLKYAKFLSDWSPDLSSSFGLTLEIMPLQDPFSVGTGESLPIQVLFNGAAVSNPTVEYLGQVVNVDVNGTASIVVGAEVLQVIEASYDNPTTTNPIVSYATSLTIQAQATSVPEPSSLLALGGVELIFFTIKRQPNS